MIAVVMSAQGRSHGQKKIGRNLSALRWALGSVVRHLRGPAGPAGPAQFPSAPTPPPPVSEDIGCDAVEMRPGYHVTYRQADMEPCAAGPTCREFHESTVAMVACSPAQLIKHDGSSRKVLSSLKCNASTDNSRHCRQHASDLHQSRRQFTHHRLQHLGLSSGRRPTHTQRAQWKA